MTDTKFTKGGWKLITENKNSSICSTSSGHFYIETNDTHKFISIQNEHKEESEANAHLIAVAPDMYKMIEDLNLTISELNQGYNENHMATELLKSSELLLKKARGE